MEQIFNQTSPEVLPQRKENNIRDILTIIFLVLIPLVGIILMWTISSWSKKVKVVVTLVLGLPVIIAMIGILASIVLVSANSAKDKAKDAKVMAEMIMMGVTAEIYHDKNGGYLNLSSDPDVFDLQKRIQNEAGKWPGIIASNDGYCANVILSDGKTKYCIDSAGRRGENLGCSSTQLICISY